MPIYEAHQWPNFGKDTLTVQKDQDFLLVVFFLLSGNYFWHYIWWMGELNALIPGTVVSVIFNREAGFSSVRPMGNILL